MSNLSNIALGKSLALPFLWTVSINKIKTWGPNVNFTQFFENAGKPPNRNVCNPTISLPKSADLTGMVESMLENVESKDYPIDVLRRRRPMGENRKPIYWIFRLGNRVFELTGNSSLETTTDFVESKVC